MERNKSESGILENLSTGFIKLFRSVTQKAWYKKSEHFHLFCHLLLKASHSGYETFYNGGVINLRPGQLVTGRKKLSTETGINESKVERILKLFEIEQQIEQATNSSCRLISICNWGGYQQSEQQIEQRPNNKRTTSEQRVNTIQEGKEGINKENKVKNAAKVLNILFDVAWQLYDKKQNKVQSEKQWIKLTDNEREIAINHIPEYVKSKPDKIFRKNLDNYLKNRIFNEEILKANGNKTNHKRIEPETDQEY